MLKIGPPEGGRPIPTLKITDWKSVDRALENRHSTPQQTVVEKCEWVVSASSKVSARHSRIDKSEKRSLRRSSAYPTPEYRSRTRALQREVKARVQEF
ncbi:hypothetical protein EVAR_57698_1 [Eumeta japonica]|uniref:Uncharacterized protein n=1 Tax=Eumeta variegata TaxID=151549 RepID=A0A4C1Y8S1_EUMVA|nr:hypothetical protein EVAR_57698_1 [Eumeta japonica]